jgi:DNA-binding FadR family transcriptional regulator
MEDRSELKIIEKKTLYKRVGEALRAYIIENGLQKGDKLPTEMELVKSLGVSRNSVREGIRYLETLGYIETMIKTGIVVKADNLDPLKDILHYNYARMNISFKDLSEARKLLEMDAAELAAECIDAEQIERIQASIARSKIEMENQQDIDDEDRFFHRTLFAVSRNKIIEQFNIVLDEFFTEHVRQKLTLHKSEADMISENWKTIQEHERILAAIMNKDIDSLKKEIELHLNY